MRLILILFALALHANTIAPPTLLVTCSGYEQSADCVTGTIVYFLNGYARTEMLPVSRPAESEYVPTWPAGPDLDPLPVVPGILSATPEPDGVLILIAALGVMAMIIRAPGIRDEFQKPNGGDEDSA